MVGTDEGRSQMGSHSEEYLLREFHPGPTDARECYQLEDGACVLIWLWTMLVEVCIPEGACVSSACEAWASTRDSSLRIIMRMPILWDLLQLTIAVHRPPFGQAKTKMRDLGDRELRVAQ